MLCFVGLISTDLPFFLSILKPAVAAPVVAPAYNPQPTYNPTTHHTTGTRSLTQEKLAKLRSQLDVVQGNVQVMSEMLIAVTPGEESPEDRDLLKVRI